MERAERRQASRMVFWERRCGFDRRGETSAIGRALAGLRETPAGLAVLLVALNVMNVIDFLMTLHALRSGDAEANPIMAAMYAYGPAPAAVFKLLCVAAASWVVWRMRSYRRILLVGLGAFVVYAGVTAFHFYGHRFL
jgi:hypothetical protein